MALLVCSSCHTQRHVSSGKHKHKGENVVRPRHNKKPALGKYQKKIVEEAMTWLGTPYKYAAQEKGKATDCSGLVMKVYEDVTGWKLPRNSEKQALFCDYLEEEDIEPGDLVFFATGKKNSIISHVGIMIDDENFIHASPSKGVVVSNVKSSYYVRTFMMYGRIPKRLLSSGK